MALGGRRLNLSPWVTGAFAASAETARSHAGAKQAHHPGKRQSLVPDVGGRRTGEKNQHNYAVDYSAIVLRGRAIVHCAARTGSPLWFPARTKPRSIYHWWQGINNFGAHSREEGAAAKHPRRPRPAAQCAASTSRIVPGFRCTTSFLQPPPPP